MENFIHDKFGYCYYVLGSDKKPLIYNLYVEPEYRRQGHARKYIKYVINEIRKTGYEGEIEVEALPRDKGIDFKKLVLFYKSMELKIISE